MFLTKDALKRIAEYLGTCARCNHKITAAALVPDKCGVPAKKGPCQCPGPVARIQPRSHR
jgi:hypothetical protein